MPTTDVDLSIIVPVYRSEATLRELHERLTGVLSKLDLSYEIVLVDDASPDDSWRVMQELRAVDERVKIIQHMRNFGQHHALLCGMAHCGGKLVVTLDDDLQHPPEEIPKMVAAIASDETVDVVIGAYEGKQHNWLRNLATRALTGIVNWVFQNDKSIELTSFRIMRRIVVEQLLADRSTFPRINIILLGVTNRIRNLPVNHSPRKHGRSTYTLRKLIRDAVTNVLSNSALPLQLVSYLGFFSATVSVLLGILYLCRYLLGGISVAGWTTVVLLILFSSGILLFSFGVVGEYLIRILKEVRQPPRYIVRRKEL